MPKSNADFLIDAIEYIAGGGTLNEIAIIAESAKKTRGAERIYQRVMGHGAL